jgi:2-polyprenyl-3-methyl-5-hydroxy-6-metoxy-1,4-benzoquinol methylase
MLGAVGRYVIRGGRDGYNRLLVLARASWPDTAALFDRAGIGPGMQCVDLGCGGGEVTFELARLVAPGGSVTGVDMDEVKLDLARKAAVSAVSATLSLSRGTSATGTSRTATAWCMRGLPSSI